MEACLKKLTPNIVLYDLLILLKQFAVMETYGTSYLFFGSIGQINGDRNGNYPLFFVEVNFDPGMADCIFLNIPRTW